MILCHAEFMSRKDRATDSRTPRDQQSHPGTNATRPAHSKGSRNDTTIEENGTTANPLANTLYRENEMQ